MIDRHRGLYSETFEVTEIESLLLSYVIINSSMAFILVEWPEENRFSIVPVTMAKKRESLKVGAYCEFKWKEGKKRTAVYNGLVLAMDDKRTELRKLEDQLIEGDLSVDELLDRHRTSEESKVDSSTPDSKIEHVNATPLSSSTVASKNISRALEKAKKIQAAKERYFHMLESTGGSHLAASDEIQPSQERNAPNTQTLSGNSGTPTAPLRQKKIFPASSHHKGDVSSCIDVGSASGCSEMSLRNTHRISSSKDRHIPSHSPSQEFLHTRSSGSSPSNQGANLVFCTPNTKRPPAHGDMVTNLQSTKKMKSSVRNVNFFGRSYGSSITIGSFPSLKNGGPTDAVNSKSGHYNAFDTGGEYNNEGCEEFDYAPVSEEFTQGIGSDEDLGACHGPGPSVAFNQKSKDIPLIALWPGYSAHLTQFQLDEAVDNAGNSPTKLIRNLLMVFFKPQELANSSAYGTRKYPKLPQDILGACIKFTMSKYPQVLKTRLVDAINDKCANFRRNQK